MESDARPPSLEYIRAESCSTEFGNPSGHSLSSALFSIMLFLDMFHDQQKTFRRVPLRKSEVKPREGFWKFNYFLWLILAFYWAITIPITRYILGVHSLDQVIYGSFLGLWAGFTCHFLLRDIIIKHIKKLVHQKAKYLQI